MRALAIIVLLGSCSLATAQSPAVQSRFKTGGDGSNSSAIEQSEWEMAKKVTYFPELVPQKMPQTNPFNHPDKVTAGAISSFDGWRFKVIQVVDSKNCLLSFGESVYWFADYPTSDLSDGEVIRILGPVKMLEQKKYTSVLNAGKTVRAFTLLTREAVKEERAKSVKGLCAGITLKNGETISVLAKRMDKTGFYGISSDGDEVHFESKELTPSAIGILKKQLKPIKTKK